jgi:hypothetical protein
MLPQNLESWIFLLVACIAGFMIGQWIKKRRNKTLSGNETINPKGDAYQRKRVSKKERRKGHDRK